MFVVYIYSENSGQSHSKQEKKTRRWTEEGCYTGVSVMRQMGFAVMSDGFAGKALRSISVLCVFRSHNELCVVGTK